MTFNTFGAYGHPDYIKINQATAAAFQQLQGEPDAPQKLYYATMLMLILRVGIAMLRLRGKDPRKGGRNNDMDYVASSPITTKVDTVKYIEPAWKAMECYTSQMQLSVNGASPAQNSWPCVAGESSTFTRLSQGAMRQETG